MYEISPFLKQTGPVTHFLSLKIVTDLAFWNRKESRG